VKTVRQSLLPGANRNLFGVNYPVILIVAEQQSVVMISLEDYEALQETAYLLRAPKNARRLLESVAELEQGGGCLTESTS
jgi:antitoxin YefM